MVPEIDLRFKDAEELEMIFIAIADLADLSLASRPAGLPDRSFGRRT
jgi:hypothetical protein